MTKRPDRAPKDPLEAVQQLLDAEHSGALGDARRASNRVGQRFSQASSAAASHLLAKVVVRLERGDESSARAFVARAMDLPYDEHEENVPALWEVHMMLFTAFSDDVEESEHGDLGWLDRAEVVVSGCGEAVQREVRSCLAALFDMELSGKEQRRLRCLVGDAGKNDDPFDGIIDRTQRIDGVIGMLRALLLHSDLVDAAIRSEPQENGATCHAVLHAFCHPPRDAERKRGEPA